MVMQETNGMGAAHRLVNDGEMESNRNNKSDCDDNDNVDNNGMIGFSYIFSLIFPTYFLPFVSQPLTQTKYGWCTI